MSRDRRIKVSVRRALAACHAPVERSFHPRTDAVAIQIIPKSNPRCAFLFSQVKGGLFRTKNLIVEDPTFQIDAEQNFGHVLNRWVETGAARVAATSVPLKVLELSLSASVAQALEASPTEMLHAIHSLITLYDKLASVPRDLLPGTIELVQQMVLQLGIAYRHAPVAGPSNSNERLYNDAQAKLASMIASHGDSGAWAIALVHPRAGGTLSLLQAVVSYGSPLTPKELLQLLSQCDFETIAEGDSKQIIQSLCTLLTLIDDGDEPSTSRACSALVSLIKYLLVQDAEPTVCYAALEGLLQALFAICKGTTIEELQSSLNMIDTVGFGSVDVQILAKFVFATQAADQYRNGHILRSLLTNIPFGWVAVRCPPPLCLRWLLWIVSASTAIETLETGNDGTVANIINTCRSDLSEDACWDLSYGAAQHDVGEVHTMCMVEVCVDEY